MAYEIYSKQHPTRSTSPIITISPLGRCSLNRAAAENFHREAVENVLLLWDKENYKFAIRPITKKDSRSFSIRYSKRGKDISGAAFSGVMFLRHINYDFAETKTYPIRLNSEEGFYEVELPKERFQGAQQPLVAVEGGRKLKAR